MGDQFERLPDEVLLDVFGRIGDVKALGRCALVSRRFHALVPLVDSVFVRVDCVISDDPPPRRRAPRRPLRRRRGPPAARGRGALAHLARLVLGGIVRPIQALGQILSRPRRPSPVAPLPRPPHRLLPPRTSPTIRRLRSAPPPHRAAHRRARHRGRRAPQVEG